MDEDMSPRFFCDGFGIERYGVVGGVWTVLGTALMFWLLESFRRDRQLCDRLSAMQVV